MENPIAMAVAPLKEKAVLATQRLVEERAEKITKTLILNDFDLKKAFSLNDPLRTMAQSITRQCQIRFGWYREQSIDSYDFFLSNQKRNAESQFNLYVEKLIKKIGEVKSASLEGNSLWSYSILTVEKPDGTIEKWKTQEITNFSKHGKVFNQFPTRKLK